MIGRYAALRVERSAAASLALALSLACAGVAVAQDPGPGAADSVSRWPIAVWGSAGLGPGSVQSSTTNSGPVALTTRINVSAGPLLVTLRDNDIGAVFGAGNGVKDRGLLFGARTPLRRAFGSLAVGYASATPRYDCENCGPNRAGASAGVLAYDILGHVDFPVIGLAAGFSGTAGAANVSYSAVTVSLELGWFGR